jgi:hypothetical protein
MGVVLRIIRSYQTEVQPLGPDGGGAINGGSPEGGPLSGAFKVARINRTSRKGVLFHSDRGTPYYLQKFREKIA